MAADLLGVHWNAADVDLLASGVGGAGRGLPSNAWMALRRLGWTVARPRACVSMTGSCGWPRSRPGARCGR
ncbi:hypothetical protein [Streptomyces sp. NPDC059862]|uniref:hypothetical protein n=1 Tax=unclassified Streptomyces TaxID=2593676 RepID=UPI00362D9B0C